MTDRDYIDWLKSENERLLESCQRNQDVIANLFNQRSELRAANRLLIEAGDEMADTLNSTYTKEVKEMNLRQWAAAKAGIAK